MSEGPRWRFHRFAFVVLLRSVVAIGLVWIGGAAALSHLTSPMSFSYPPSPTPPPPLPRLSRSVMAAESSNLCIAFATNTSGHIDCSDAGPISFSVRIKPSYAYTFLIDSALSTDIAFSNSLSAFCYGFASMNSSVCGCYHLGIVEFPECTVFQATKVKVAMAENSDAVCWFFLTVQSKVFSTQLLCARFPIVSSSMLFNRSVGETGTTLLPGNIDNDMDVIIIPDINYVCAARSFSDASYSGCYHFDTPLTEHFSFSGSPGPVSIRAPTNSSFVYVLTRYPVPNLPVNNETLKITTYHIKNATTASYTEGLSVFKGPINSISAMAATDGSGHLLYAACSTAGGRYVAWHNDNTTSNPPSYSNGYGAIASDVVFMPNSDRFCYVFADGLQMEFRCGMVTNFSSEWILDQAISFGTLVNSTRVQLGLTPDQTRFGVLVDLTTAVVFTVSATGGGSKSNSITFVARVDQIFTLRAVRFHDSSPSSLRLLSKYCRFIPS